jgi:hypothetical protein
MLKYVVFLVGITVCAEGLAQDATAENAFTQTAIDSAIARYHQFTDKRSRLLNGLEYTGYAGIEGHAYFIDNKWQTGSVMYDGIFYNHVPMQYDLLKDFLVVLHPDGFPAFRLFNEKVSTFTLLGHRFIRIEHDSLSQFSPPTGYYDEMHNNKLQVLVRRTKFIDEKIAEKLERTFIAKDYYYIRKEGTWHSVKSYNDLLTVLKDRAGEIRQYLKKNKIKYRKAKETAIVQAVGYYDSLNK